MTTTAGTPTTAGLAASVPPGSDPRFAVVDQPEHGSAAIAGDLLTYTPEPGFVGPDRLSYSVASTSSAGSTTSAPGVVVVNVTASTAPPSIEPIADINTDGTIASRDVTATAPGSSGLTFVASDLPHFATFTDLGGGHGVVLIDGTSATPGEFTAKVTATADGGQSTAEVHIHVGGDRRPVTELTEASTPYQTAAVVEVRASDPDGDGLSYVLRSPPAHGSVTVDGARFTYTPRPGFSGIDGFAFEASDGTLASTNMATVTVGAPPSITPPELDASTFKDLGGSPVKYVSSTLTTGQPDDLLLAFIASDGPANDTQQIKKVTGGNLNWTLVVRSNDKWGTAEIWQAKASGIFSAAVTAVPTRTGYHGSITVAAFRGAAPNTGGSAAATGTGARPNVALTTAKPGSLVWAVGHDWDTAKKRGTDAGQEIFHQYVDTAVHDTFWTQRASGPIGTPGGLVIGSTAAAKSRWQMAVVEIQGK